MKHIWFDDDGTYTAEQLADNVLGSDERYADLLAELQEREASAEAVNEKMREIAEKLVPKSEAQILKETAEEKESGVLMYYAEQLQ